MQNLYKYTRYFQPALNCPDGVNPRFSRAFRKFWDLYSVDFPPEEEKISIDYHLPELTSYSQDYYNILYIFSKYFQVRPMYRKLLVDDQVIKGFFIIGETHRVNLWINIVDHYFTELFKYQEHIKQTCKVEAKEAGYKDVRKYASQLVAKELDATYRYIKKFLVDTDNYDRLLEIYIMGQQKLSYKDYNQTSNSYWHAVSGKKFFHKRMML